MKLTCYICTKDFIQYSFKGSFSPVTDTKAPKIAFTILETLNFLLLKM